MRHVLVLAAALLVSAGTLAAHHAGAEYDREHPVTMTGTVATFEFANPHARIHFDVKDEKGAVTRWIAETAPPMRLFRVGWKRDSLKPGDSITVTGFPAKDGSKTLGLRRLMPPNGGEPLTEGNE